tara:strand:- start:169 stop:546 length:378 start_codon:yes stop_codon:yes gene_type:complete
MRRIKSQDMKPEILVRKMVYALGFRYRLHQKNLPGKPDLVFRKLGKIIFVHGCFWHQHSDPNCRDGRMPKSNKSYWNPKLEGNIERFAAQEAELRAQGWEVLVVWECETKNKNYLRSKLLDFLSK